MQPSAFCVLILASALTVTAAWANDLDVPVLEHGGDGQAANCSSSKVSGLKAAGAEGFLSVRAGPGGQYREIAKLHNGDVVTVFENHGKWAGVVYGSTTVHCSSTKTRPVLHENTGWVHTDWLTDYAG